MTHQRMLTIHLIFQGPLVQVEQVPAQFPAFLRMHEEI
jgi:hypothetical protein